ncbi:MAG TPA: hypothetical protein VKJ45_23075 [Blastocatellia bacterium]|nr:hypothetical protein [Blastocatellia bacterium]
MRKFNRAIFITLVVSALWFIPTTLTLAAPPSDPAGADQAFQKLKTLAGRWEGTTPAGKIALEYEIVSGGTVLIEREYMPQHQGEHQMITVYHLDNGRLVLTHYCHEGNQPHMQARPFNASSSEIRFEFTGAGNLVGAAAENVMHEVVLKLNSPDELATEWTLYSNGQRQAPMALLYHRVK